MANIIHVDGSYGGPEASDGSEDRPYTTIQAAVDAASAGDTVQVAAGTYNENVTIGESITLAGDGRGTTTIIGSAGAGAGEGGTIYVPDDINDVTISGFTIVGADSTSPGVERATIYLSGGHDKITITDNNVVANGEAAILSEYGAALSNITVSHNEISGQTFSGTVVGGGPGVGGSQYTTPNWPRPLVFLGTNTDSASPAQTNVVFSHNAVTGTTGGLNSAGNPQSNVQVNIDVPNSTVSDNTFTGYVNGFQPQLRVREENTDVTNNSFSNDSGGNVGALIDTDGVQGMISGNGTAPIVIEGGSSAAEVLTGGDGNDYFVADSLNDTIDGGNGLDTIDMSAAGASGSFVDLDAGLAFSTATGIDFLESIENVKGSAGNDGLFGSDGDNVFIATAGNDVIDGRGDGLDSDTFDASAATSDMQVDLDGGAVTGAFIATLTDIENVKTGSGADTIRLSDAANSVDAGSSAPGTIDVAVTSANYADTAISWNATAGAFQVGNDTLKNVEKVVFENSTADGGSDAADTGVWLVTNSSQLTYALAHAGEGDVIKLASGDYAGTFNITTENLTLESASGVPGDVVFHGTLTGDVPAALKAGGTSDGITGLSVQADGVTISGITLTGYRKAIDLQTNDGLTIDNVVLDNNVHSIYKETGTADVTNFVLRDSLIKNAYQGLTVNADDDATGGYEGSFDGVQIYGTHFEHIVEKGIYVEQLSNANIHDIWMDDVGQYGRVYAFAPSLPTGQNGAGIDINLKFNDFSGITISDFHFTDVGMSDKDGAGTSHVNGGAIHVKARDDGSYHVRDATLDEVTIKDGEINGTSTGIRIGEPGKTTAGATDVTIENVTITNATVGTYDNQTTTPRTVVLTDGADVVTVNPTSTGGFVFEGGAGNDSITGGNAVDAAVFNAAYSADAVSGSGNTFTVNAGADGTDTLKGIEKAVFNNGTVADTSDDTTVWLVDDAADLTYALAHAVDGDVIQLSSGDFTGDFTVSSAVTILGANHGVGTDETRGAESRIIGHLIINTGSGPLADDVTVDGVEFFVNNVLDFNDYSKAAVRLHGAGDIKIANSLFYSDVVGGNAVVIGIMIDTTVTGNVKIDNNSFDGSKHSGYSGASWASAIYSDGTAASLEISNNEFQWVRTGVNLDGYDDARIDVHHNNFVGGTSSGTAFSIGVPAPGTSYGNIHDNVLDGAASDFNFKNLTTGITFDLGSTGNTSTTAVEILGSQGADSIDGGDGNDVIAGDGTLPTEGNMPSFGNDTLNGHDGDDVLFGGRGNDVLDGGDGNDTVLGGDGDDLIIASAGDDQVDGGTGRDTLSLSGSATLAVQGGVWVATTADGTATLSNVEIVDDSAAGRILLVGAGGYATIQAAVDAAQDGDTILVAAGTYAEDINIDVDVTILGANAGVAANGVRGDETIIQGGVFFASTAEDATLNGFSVTGSFTNPAFEYSSIFVQANGVAILNNIVVADANAVSGDGSGLVTSITIGGATISGNSFTGYTFGAYINPNGTAAASTITGNFFTNNFQAIVLEAGPSVSDVSGNTFSGSGASDIRAAIRTSTDTDLSDVIGVNAYSGGAAAQVRIDSSGNTEITGTEANDLIQAGASGYANIGSSVTFHGGAGNDVLKGGTGNDYLDGGTGDDTLLGGTGKDTIVGGDGADSIDAGDGIDTVVFEHDISEYTIQWNAGTQTYDISRNGTHDKVKGAEFLKFGSQTVDVQGDPEAAINQYLPVFSSPATASVLENAAASTIVYDAEATDGDSAAVFGNIVYSLGGADAAAFTIDSATGEVRLKGSADYETKASYTFNVVATQGSTSASKAVTLNVTDENDNDPVFSSGTTATVAEGTTASAVVYDANATDADTSFGAIVYSLDGADKDAFTIDSTNGQVKLKVAADYETKTSYSFIVVATQGSTAASRAVTLNVTNVNEGVGGLGTKNVQVEAGSEKAPLGTLATTTGVTFDVVALDKGGGHVYLGDTELAVGQTGLTLEQVNALTFSSKGSGSIQFLAHDGSDTDTLQVNLAVTAGVSKTYTGTDNADRIDGADGNDKVLGLKGSDMLLGGAGKDTIDGGRGNDTIFGGSNSDSIKGASGNDVIHGGVGRDTLEGGGGKDKFVFDTALGTNNVDTILDFTHDKDTIVLDADIFAAIGSSLGYSEFRKNTTGNAQDSNDRIIYNKNDGKLYYDADGSGSGSKVLIAKLDTHLSLSHHDFDIV